jgi:hypothetical protein
MIVGFLLATVTAVGAAEPDRPASVAVTLDGLVNTSTIYHAVFGCTGTVQRHASIAD